MEKDFSGFLLINKASGNTSFSIVRSVRKALSGARVGHAGTLDPLATGLLILAVGKGTKKISVFANLEKEYDFTIKLGVSTATDDVDGVVISTKEAGHITEAQIRRILPEFTGKISQRPPDYSAVRLSASAALDSLTFQSMRLMLRMTWRHKLTRVIQPAISIDPDTEPSIHPLLARRSPCRWAGTERPRR